MKKIWKIIIALVVSAGIFFLQILAKEFLPYPLNQINIIFVAMAWLLILTGRANVLWYGAPLAFLIEVFGSSQFGLNSLLLLFSFLLIFWLLINYFTNRSLLIVMLLGVIGMTFYRSCYILYHLIFTSGEENINWSLGGIFSLYGIEIIVTTITLTLFYLLTTIFIKKLNPSYISISKL